MFDLKLLILEANEFAGLTEASIRKEMPGVSYTVTGFNPEKGVLGSALAAAGDELTLVVVSGVVLRIKDGDIPPRSVLSQYHICAPRNQVYVDHDKYKAFYSYVDRPANPKEIDICLFIINPAMWTEHPKADKGALQGKKILAMPRYMDHKCDDVISKCLSTYEALKYGMLGASASALNYLPILQKGEASVIERYAYCLDQLANYLDLLPEPQAEVCRSLAEKSVMAGTRSKLAEALGYQG